MDRKHVRLDSAGGILDLLTSDRVVHRAIALRRLLVAGQRLPHGPPILGGQSAPFRKKRQTPGAMTDTSPPSGVLSQLLG